MEKRWRNGSSEVQSQSMNRLEVSAVRYHNAVVNESIAQNLVRGIGWTRTQKRIRCRMVDPRIRQDRVLVYDREFAPCRY